MKPDPAIRVYAAAIAAIVIALLAGILSMCHGCAEPRYYRTVVVPSYTVHLYTGGPYGWVSQVWPTMAISGEIRGGRFVPNRDVAGHEFEHALRKLDGSIADPDGR
jgi:hypothetical protein